MSRDPTEDDEDCTDTDGMGAMERLSALADCMGDGDDEGHITVDE